MFLGAKYVENCKVFRVLTENGHIQAVETSLGKVNCEYFVNCAGMVNIIFYYINKNKIL